MRSLPVDLSSFVGRERELGELAPLLKASRLLSLVGAGGVGKTRLAVQLARRHLGDFSDGVCLVDLAGLTDPRLVPQAVASALGISEQARRHILATLSDRLRDKQLLLLMDNCEHLLAECAAVADALLRVAPGLRILVTSRRSLGIIGEVVFRVPSLPAPPEAVHSQQALADYDAVRLFVERARAVNPEFGLTKDSAPAVAQICRRLDGIPLAIELAAVRTSVLTPEQVNLRLDDRFRLLVGGSRTGLPRHRTLRAMMEWSYSLLGERERVAWRQLSAFAGDFMMEAAEAVIGGEAVDRGVILDLVGALTEQSILVVQQDAGEARFRMLETVRQYGVERLAQSEEEAAVRGRHLEWVLALSERAESEWRGPNQAAWLLRVDRDLDNIRAALDWARSDPGRAATGLQIVAALWLFWQVRGHLGEGRMWLEALLALQNERSALRGKALNVDGFLAYSQGDTATALRLLEESVVVGREVGDEVGVALALLRLGIGAYYHGDLTQAVRVLDESLARYRNLNDPVGIHVALYELAEALSYAGDYTRARRLHEEGLVLKREIGDRWHIALSLFGLGLLDYLEGHYREAAEHERESLRLRLELDDRWGMALCLEVLGWIGAAGKSGRTAARLLGAAEAARNRMGVTLIQPHIAYHQRSLELVSAALGPDSAEHEFNAGGALPAEGAAQLALDSLDRSEAKRSAAGSLTPREVQIANLVSSGMSNKEIARKLSIAERTADAHVEHIMNKLGLHSRLQIARWADQHRQLPER